ncbi:hypothetical protein CDAR_218841 [Caerostris darwini]|uniref:Uncharacterized protein n=1 Tax=Caerostris darwini TaxID=1538125 RepID=A0AAV4VP20_9ARAC|nr:hypothetical protein CDAR_218841 [Caerostris darwini]
MEWRRSIWRQISTPRNKTKQQPPSPSWPQTTSHRHPSRLPPSPPHNLLEIDEGDTRDEPLGGASYANPCPTPTLVRMNHAPRERESGRCSDCRTNLTPDQLSKGLEPLPAPLKMPPSTRKSSSSSTPAIHPLPPRGSI